MINSSDPFSPRERLSTDASGKTPWVTLAPGPYFSWVEGFGEAGSCKIELYARDVKAANPATTVQRVHWVTINVFQWDGPQNVPAYADTPRG